MNLLTSYEVEQLNKLTARTQEMLFGNKIQEIITLLGTLDPGANNDVAEGTPINAVNASKLLTLTGVVKHGETITIQNPNAVGADVYEFLADEAQKKTLDAYIPVDISAHAGKSAGSLTVDTKPTSGDTMTIGTKVYTFVPVGTATADGEISIGADLAGAQANIIAAINGTDGVNDPNPFASAGAFAANVSVITALVGGVSGDDIVTTETFTAASNVFAAAKLANGSDCSAANAITALVTAVTASDTQGVGATDGNGDTVLFTADTAGVIGNDIEIGETLANGAFAEAAIKLSGGVDGTVGTKLHSMLDDSYLYYCVADNTIADKNWRRISLGSAY
jgi:hypothetical protein